MEDYTEIDNQWLKIAHKSSIKWAKENPYSENIMDVKYRVLLFGGTFNPIHNGHLVMAQEAIERLDFNEVIFIPSATPPHKGDTLSFSHRLKMVKLATEDIDYFKVSDIESKRDGPSYTIDTIRHFKSKLRENAKVYWLIGTDTIYKLKTWHKPKELLKECRFILAERNPYIHYAKSGDFLSFLREHTKDIVDIPIMNHFVPLVNAVLEISSSDVRDKIFCKEKYGIRFLVPPKVEQYIYDNKLYTNK